MKQVHEAHAPAQGAKKQKKARTVSEALATLERRDVMALGRLASRLAGAGLDLRISLRRTKRRERVS